MIDYELDKYSQFRISPDGSSARGFNYRTGALAQFDLLQNPSVRRVIDGGAFENEREVVEALDFVMNFMVVAGADSTALVKDLYKGIQSATDDLNLTVLTTLACNFSCYYCYEKREPGRMGGQVRSRVLELLETRLPNLTRASINWYGGEPLLVKDAIVDITAHVRDQCNAAGVAFRSKMISNCYLLDRGVAQDLSRAGVDEVQVSFDGPMEIHDIIRHQSGKPTFNRIVENIVNASEFFKIIIRVNISERNSERIDELLDQLASAGVADFAIIYFANLHANGVGCSDMSEPELNDMIKTSKFVSQSLEYKRSALRKGFKVRTPLATTNICSAVVEGGFVIEPTGAVQKCYLDVGSSAESIGKIGSKGLAAIPISTIQKYNRRKWTSFSPFEDPECLACVALPICYSGCPWEAMRGRPKADRCHPLRSELSQYLNFFFDSLDSGAEFDPVMKTLQMRSSSFASATN
ncbi:radical SAM/SPASM domain-containing protein [Acidovorax carolinensis]|uniref:radical SAM/SPASM domain-containing protein n=1 Tax=Acidovorax carolinensis TaxID=553814 RepID=UPI0013905217|nr:radical SAM protein [Acidovorax carolinensis]